MRERNKVGVVSVEHSTIIGKGRCVECALIMLNTHPSFNPFFNKSLHFFKKHAF